MESVLCRSFVKIKESTQQKLSTAEKGKNHWLKKEKKTYRKQQFCQIYKKETIDEFADDGSYR